MADEMSKFKQFIDFKKNAANAWYGSFELPSYTMSIVAAPDQGMRVAKSAIAEKLYVNVKRYCLANQIDLSLILAQKTLAKTKKQ